jgi:CDP-glucose 4,6-dehydratase
VNVTTDKCYENREWVWPYRENEAMGGYDPYSSSKACAELITAAYRRSYLQEKNVHLASARAGNVIGGGDWAADRLIPDFLNALHLKKKLVIRSPYATRPWQHVLEPLSGYLRLSENLYTDGESFADAWNFGPEEEDSKTVEWIMNKLCSLRSEASWEIDKNPQLHEANTLKLDSSKAKFLLGWQPLWDLHQAIEKTLEWDQAWHEKVDMAAFTLSQIQSYQASTR